MSTVAFTAPQEWLNADLLLESSLGRTSVAVRISAAALDGVGLLATQCKAIEKARAGLWEPDGSILVRSCDFGGTGVRHGAAAL